jgi:hypothetical protein
MKKGATSAPFDSSRTRCRAQRAYFFFTAGFFVAGFLSAAALPFS